jgi:hypothetical protein
MGLKLWRRQRRTGSADRVEWDEYGGLVDVNANAGLSLPSVLAKEKKDVLQE